MECSLNIKIRCGKNTKTQIFVTTKGVNVKQLVFKNNHKTITNVDLAQSIENLLMDNFKEK